MLRNGTYFREPDGATLIYFSPYSFEDSAESFRKRYTHDDGWKLVLRPEHQELWDKIPLQPGESVRIGGGEII